MRAFALVIAAFSTLVLTHPFTLTLERKYELRAECAVEHNLSLDDLNIMNNRTDNALYPERVQCFLKCVGEKLGVLKDGKPVDTMVEGLLRESKAFNTSLATARIERFNHCKTLTGVNECESAAKMYKCVFNE